MNPPEIRADISSLPTGRVPETGQVPTSRPGGILSIVPPGVSLCRSSSFAPLGLVLVPLPTHGLRLRLHSYAAYAAQPSIAGPLFSRPSCYHTDSSGTKKLEQLELRARLSID